MTRLLLLLVVWLAANCAHAQQQGYFEPQAPPVVAVPQPPVVVQPPPIVYQPPPQLIPIQPHGVWMPVRRPTLIGNMLFGPVWTFVPYQRPPQPPPQQYPPPQ